MNLKKVAGFLDMVMGYKFLPLKDRFKGQDFPPRVLTFLNST